MSAENPFGMPPDPLEAELARLKPRAPSPFLRERLERTMTTQPWSRRLHSWALAGAAALLAAGIAWHPWQNGSGEQALPGEPVSAARGASVPSTPSVATRVSADQADALPGKPLRLVPAGARGYVVGWEDAGAWFPDNGPPVRRIRLRYIEATEWREQTGTARYRLWRPAEQEIWLPLDAY